jgi:two-component sensor histidine kinase
MTEVNLSKVLELFFKRNPAPFCILDWRTGEVVKKNNAWETQVKTSLAPFKTYLFEHLGSSKNPIANGFEHHFSLKGVSYHCFGLNSRCLGIQQLPQSQPSTQLAYLETLSARKSELISHLSHELRTPLTAILGWPEMILDAQDPMPGIAIQAAEAIQRDGLFLNQLLESLLDLSQIESGSLRLSKEWVDLSLLAHSATNMLTERTRFKSQELILKLPEKPLYNQVDALRIQQAMMNYISNAIKYTPENGIIEVSLYREKDRDIFCVKDNGQGLPQELAPHIFERFVRAEEVLGTEGAGIGLSLVKKLMDLHGGTYWVESHPGEGSRFFLALPILEHAPIILPEIEILCVIEHAHQKQELTQLLCHHPVVYRLRETLPSLQEMARTAYDLVILSTDLHQPHTQAWEKAVHTLFPSQKILAWLSPAYRLQAPIEEDNLSGYDGVLRSPLRAEDLLQYIQKRRD